MTTKEEQMQEDIKDLAGYVHDLAKSVLTKEDMDDDYEDDVEKNEDDGYDDDDDMDLMEGDPYDDPMMDDEPQMPMDMMGDDEEWDFDAAYKAVKELKKRMAKKGYASSAKVKANEHDAPFDEKDSDLGGGNEPQPAGDQGGEREDETFGPGGMAYTAMRKQLSAISKQVKQLSGGKVIAKAISPAGHGNDREGGEEVVLTREMQEQFKSLSFKQLNKMREDVSVEQGGLPRNVLMGR